MDNMTTSSTQVYADLSSLQQLRLQAQQHKDSAITEVSKQFEAIFTQLILKSMRQANAALGSEDDIMNSDNVQFYQSLYDSQVSLQLAKTNSMGLAEIIAQQLSYNKIKKSADQVDTAKVAATTNTFIPRMVIAAQEQEENDSVIVGNAALDRHRYAKDSAFIPTTSPTQTFSSPEAFIKEVWSSAKQVADKLGLDPKILVAQAALETGWGSHIMRNTLGEMSYNLFGIKADKSWDKESVAAPTFEYRNGNFQKENADFRKYNSFAESFSDYANFLQSNPRYQTALSKTSDPYEFTRALQQAGYATDPNYARKIQTILQNSALKNYVGD